MFNDKKFNVSLLFSTAWHLFWLSAICVVITPTVRLQDSYTDVNFLGPILEKTAFEIMAESSIPYRETLYSAQGILKYEVPLKVEGPERITKKEVFVNKPDVEVRLAKKRQLHDYKDEPTYTPERKSIFYSIKERLDNKFIEGPAKNRIILFRPEEPSVSKLLYRDEDSFVIKLRFTLSKEGSVERVEPLVSSGYPIIDQEGIKYLKQWKFVPKTSRASEKEWGIITLNIKAK